MIRILLIVAVLAAALPAAAQSVIARDGWEAYHAEYQGGDTTQLRKRWGLLVLTDTTLSLHDCQDHGCRDRDKRFPPFTDTIFFTIKLSDITAVEGSSERRGPGIGRRFMWGTLANDRTEDMLRIVYQTATDAQAPVFRTKSTQATALVAKIKFRMQKAGVTLAATDEQK